MMFRHQFRRAGATATLFAAMAVTAGVTAPTASAGTDTYCHILVSAFSPCSQTYVYQHFQQNAAQYTGSGDVGVCQKFTVGSTEYGKTCGNRFSASALDNWGEKRGWAGNNSPNNHTIHGIVTGSN